MKLDNFSKIQLSTFGLQWMANSINQMAIQLEATEVNTQGFKDALDELESKLSELYEQTADFLNSQDAISTIDVSMMERISDVLLFGKDDTEEDYYSQEASMRPSCCSNTELPYVTSECNAGHVNPVQMVNLFKAATGLYGRDNLGRFYSVGYDKNDCTLTPVDAEMQSALSDYYKT